MSHDDWGPNRETFRVREMKKRIQRENLRRARMRMLAAARKVDQTRPSPPDLDVQPGRSEIARELGIRSYRGPSVVLPLPGKGDNKTITIRLPYVPMQHEVEQIPAIQPATTGAGR